MFAFTAATERRGGRARRVLPVGFSPAAAALAAIAACWLPARMAAAQTGAPGTEDPLSLRVESVVARWADGSEEPVPDEVARLISVRPGMRLRPLVVRQSVKQVFALGRFRDVRVLRETVPNGDLRLVFELDPLPRIARLRVAGAPVGEEQGLVAALRLEAGALVPDDLAVRAGEAEAWLRSRGFLGAAVEILPAPEGRDLALRIEVIPGERARVASVEALGVEAALGGQLLRALRLDAGDTWVEAEAAARLDAVEGRLREQGFLFAAAELDWRPTDAGDVQVLLSVERGPEVLLGVEGFGAFSEEARNLVNGLRRERLGPDAMEGVRQELLVRLRREGHRGAVVSVESEEDAAGRQTFRFAGAPGPRYVVGALSAEGAPPELAEAVAAALEPLPPGRPFRDAEWQAVADGLRRALRQQGYFQAEVIAGEPVPAAGPVPTDGENAGGLVGAQALDAALEIVPGPAATVRSVRFEGGSAFPDAELRAAAGLAPGAPWVVEELVNARENLESFHRDRGYLEAVVEVEAPVEAARPEAEVVFRIRPGSYFTVGGIIVAGLDATRDSLVRGRLPFREGDPLGSDDLLEVRRRLASLGIFRSVEVDLLEPEEPVSERNVLIRVVEGPRSSIGYGAGYSEREQVRAEGEWTRSNLLGVGHTLSLFGRFSLKGTRVVATYRGAESVEGDVPVFVSAFRETQDRESFDFLRSGVGVQVTRRVLGQNVYLRYDLTTSELSEVKIDRNQIDRNFADNLWLSAISASVVTDSRDDPVDPRRGRFGIVDLEWSSALLRSRAPFVKGLAQQYLFFPAGGQVVVALAARVGLAWTLGADQPPLAPITERFFAGGATTLRGYKLDRAGPLDPSGYPLGGNMLLVGNVEVRFPVFGSLRGAVFSDHGGVYSEVKSFRLGDVGHNVGAGLRWNTPLGPLRFDYGLRLGDIADSARRGQWHLTIGHAF